MPQLFRKQVCIPWYPQKYNTFFFYLLYLAKAFSKPWTSLRWEKLQVKKQNSTSESLLLWPKALHCLVVELTSEASCSFVGTECPEGAPGEPEMIKWNGAGKRWTQGYIRAAGRLTSHWRHESTGQKDFGGIKCKGRRKKHDRLMKD